MPAKSKVVAEPVFDDAPADYNDDHMDHMDIDEPPPIPVPVIKEPGICDEYLIKIKPIVFLFQKPMEILK